jgi:acyl-CoA synthetase (AMP-forming)/AMP-acid ligase II
MYAPMPFFWVGGFHRLLCIMQVGGAIVFLDAFDAGEVLDLVHRERITTLVVWPHQAKALAEHPSFRAADFARMHSAPYPLLPETRRPSAPDLIPNSIGMTETFAYHTVDPTGFVLPDDKRGACGHALPGMERRIFDPDTGQEVAAGEVGELRVRGFNLMQGLYKREREDVFEPDGFYRTGDRGRIDPDGVYFFEGRIGDMIKTGGANVSPREVEAVLNAFEEVEQAHVVGVADPDMGEIVVAAIVPSGAASLDADTLRGRLRAQLSAFKVPRKLVPCSLDDLPRTDAGKLHPGRLREWLAGRIAAES